MHSCFDGSKPCPDEGIDQTDDNCRLYLEYCKNNSLCILNTWFDHPLHHRITWHSCDGFTKRVYDYSLCKSWLHKFVLDVRVRNSYFNSDHRLVVTKLKTPVNKEARFIPMKKIAKIVKPNLDCLNNEQIKQNVLDEINNFLMENECPSSIEEIHPFLPYFSVQHRLMRCCGKVCIFAPYYLSYTSMNLNTHSYQSSRIPY